MINFSEVRTEAGQPKAADDEKPKNSTVSGDWTIVWPAKFSAS